MDELGSSKERARRRRRRARRRAITVTALVVASAAIVGSVVGLRAVERRSIRIDKEGTVSFTTGGVTILRPPDWQTVPLVKEGALFVGRTDVTAVLPILQVTNFSTSSTGSPICPNHPGPPGTFPNWGVLLYVEQDLAIPPATLPGLPWPVHPMASRPDAESRDLCLGGAEAIRWRAAGRMFEATVLAGPDASENDKATLVAAFESMRFGPLDWPEEHYGRLVVPLGPSVLVLRGTVEGDRWSLFGEPSDVGPCLHLTFSAGTELNAFGCAFIAQAIQSKLPGEVFALDTDAFRRPGTTDVEFVYGAVVPEAVRIRVELGKEHTAEIDTQLVPFDPSIRAVVIPIVKTDQPIRAVLVALDIDGRILSRTAVDLGPSGV